MVAFLLNHLLEQQQSIFVESVCWDFYNEYWTLLKTSPLFCSLYKSNIKEEVTWLTNFSPKGRPIDVGSREGINPVKLSQSTERLLKPVTWWAA
jgi:hypothetical protein